MVIIGVPKKHGKGISKYIVSAVICLVIYRHSEGQFKVPRIYKIGEILVQLIMLENAWRHDDVIKWKHFLRYWPFVRGIHRSLVNSPHKGQWRGALVFSFICVRINGWVNNRKAGDLRRCCAHCDVTVMEIYEFHLNNSGSLDNQNQNRKAPKYS